MQTLATGHPDVRLLDIQNVWIVAFGRSLTAAGREETVHGEFRGHPVSGVPDSADTAVPDMRVFQEAEYVADFDYIRGAPHLRHSGLRGEILRRLRAMVLEQIGLRGQCRVLEVGAGHGALTADLIAAGAAVTVTEMSAPSADRLQRRFIGDPRVRLLFDPTGEGVFAGPDRYDLIACVSVLHHIPDYVAFVERACGLIMPGGMFASFQDPLWYPRRSRWNLAVDRGAYYAWRLAQGEVRRGLATLSRRLRGVLDESNPSDMTEYHVVRQGVDEEALRAVLSQHFDRVEEWDYWSTQSPLLQTAMQRLPVTTTFGLLARGRHAVSGPA